MTAEEVAHVDGDVVLIGSGQVVLADGDLVADPVAEIPATNAEREAGQHVEADKASPDRRAGCDRCHAHAVTSSPSPLA